MAANNAIVQIERLTSVLLLLAVSAESEFETPWIRAAP
jgi:hypothetical protein